MKLFSQVGYSTALDIYIILCFFYTFAALTEFAVINFITIFVGRYKKQEEELNEKKEQLKKAADILDDQTIANNDKETEVTEEVSEEGTDILAQLGDMKMKVEYTNEKKAIEEPSTEAIEEIKSDAPTRMSVIHNFLSKVRQLEKYLATCTPHPPPIPSLLLYEETQYVVDRLDEISRIMFPSSFLLTHLCYWTYYFYIAEDFQ